MKIQYKHYHLSLIVCSIVLAGCGGSSSYNEQGSIGKKFATQTPYNDARYIDSAEGLTKDLNTLFGNPNATPIELKKGESLNAIFDRLGS
ncbi:MAG: hypothetical protein KAG28_08505 [Cocleimonas sp.]|nr:hypothetical protein [Cocleimonas sp.]